jgi:hypothetical protein
MAAKQLAVQEAEQRVTLAAEELHGVYRAARDRVLRLAALEAQMTASNDLLAERAAREKGRARGHRGVTRAPAPRGAGPCAAAAEGRENGAGAVAPLGEAAVRVYRRPW